MRALEELFRSFSVFRRFFPTSLPATSRDFPREKTTTAREPLTSPAARNQPPVPRLPVAGLQDPEARVTGGKRSVPTHRKERQ